jgi:hypothetical protein
MKDKPEIVVDEELQGTLRACVAKVLTYLTQ